MSIKHIIPDEVVPDKRHSLSDRVFAPDVLVDSQPFDIEVR
jgi:hypothetical protein